MIKLENLFNSDIIKNYNRYEIFNILILSFILVYSLFRQKLFPGYLSGILLSVVISLSIYFLKYIAIAVFVLIFVLIIYSFLNYIEIIEIYNEIYIVGYFILFYFAKQTVDYKFKDLNNVVEKIGTVNVLITILYSFLIVYNSDLNYSKNLDLYNIFLIFSGIYNTCVMIGKTFTINNIIERTMIIIYFLTSLLLGWCIALVVNGLFKDTINSKVIDDDDVNNSNF